MKTFRLALVDLPPRGEVVVFRHNGRLKACKERGSHKRLRAIDDREEADRRRAWRVMRARERASD
jgi:hypothetical protein